MLEVAVMTAQITSERIDDISLLMRWLLDMHIDQIIDAGLGAPHGNRQGLSYGQVAVVFVAYMLTECNHFLSPVRDWVSKHEHVLTQALGCPIRDTDFTDERLEDLRATWPAPDPGLCVTDGHGAD
jgi:hypothetical protein